MKEWMNEFLPPNNDSHGENNPDENDGANDDDEKIKESILDEDLRIIEDQRIDEIITDFFEGFDVTTAVKCCSSRMFVSCRDNSWWTAETGHFRILCAGQWTIEQMSTTIYNDDCYKKLYHSEEWY